MESGERPRVRKSIGCCAVALLTPGVLWLTLWWTWGGGVAWRYMAPYRSLVARHATQQQVIAEIGEPNSIIKTKVEFRRWLRDFSGPHTARIWSGGEIYMQWADPWHDSEGYAVYVAFDAKGRAAAAELVGH